MCRRFGGDGGDRGSTWSQRNSGNILRRNTLVQQRAYACARGLEPSHRMCTSLLLCFPLCSLPSFTAHDGSPAPCYIPIRARAASMTCGVISA